MLTRCGWSLLLSVAGWLVPAPALAQTHWYLAAIGSDTLSVERFQRDGKTISGVWVTWSDRGQRSILRHEYTIALGADDRPRLVHLELHRPDGTLVATYEARFSDDTVVVTVTPDTLPPRRMVATGAYPMLGSAMGMLGLGIAGANRDRGASDSTTARFAQVTEPFATPSVPFKVIAEGRYRVGGAGAPTTFAKMPGVVDSIVTPDGRAVLRQVVPFDLDAVVRAAAKAPE